MSALEPPLDRLNYFNGQRLEAADLRLEQDYQIRVRRWLNRTLYTWGIAKGLEVNVKTGDAHTVIVQPGLALDAAGEEIILLDATDVKVSGTPSTTPGVVFGNYLVISYSEEKTAAVNDGCAVVVNGAAGKCGCGSGKSSGGCGCGSSGAKKVKTRDLGWGAPSRIRAIPIIEMQDTFPTAESGKIVLAQIELDATCAVQRINSVIRKYVAASQPPTVRPISLEGEKDIDSQNAKTLYFHVQGGYPGSATLILFASKFSTLHYTEIGSHLHGISITSQPGAHSHAVSFGALTTSDDGNHRHEIFSDKDDGEIGSMDTGDPTTDGDKVNRRLTGPGGVKGGDGNMEVALSGPHHHSIAGGTGTAANENPAHAHTVTGNTVATGLTPAARTTGSPYEFVNQLHVIFDGVQDVTAAVIAQIHARFPAENWTTLGNALSTHPMATSGTREIDLLQLGLDLSPGQHSLTFSVPSGGGQIHWNLYIS